jgi:predicted RNA-binding protein
MCESNAFLKKEGSEEMILENVTYMKPDNGTIILTSLFGDEVKVKGKIVEIDLMAHRIVLQED